MMDVLKSRAFLVALITVAVMLLGLVVPGYTLDIEHAGGLAAVAAVCMVSYAINPAGGIGTLLLSRKFLFAGFGFVVLVLDSFHVFPNPLDLPALVTFVILISAYVLMVAKDPGNGWRGLLMSRKFIGAVVGIVLLFLRAYEVALPTGVSEEALLGMANLMAGIIAYAGYQGPPIAEVPEPELPVDEEAAVITPKRK